MHAPECTALSGDPSTILNNPTKLENTIVCWVCVDPYAWWNIDFIKLICKLMLFLLGQIIVDITKKVVSAQIRSMEKYNKLVEDTLYRKSKVVTCGKRADVHVAYNI